MKDVSVYLSGNELLFIYKHGDDLFSGGMGKDTDFVLYSKSYVRAHLT